MLVQLVVQHHANDQRGERADDFGNDHDAYILAVEGHGKGQMVGEDEGGGDAERGVEHQTLLIHLVHFGKGGNAEKLAKLNNLSNEIRNSAIEG